MPKSLSATKSAITTTAWNSFGTPDGNIGHVKLIHAGFHAWKSAQIANPDGRSGESVRSIRGLPFCLAVRGVHHFLLVENDAHEAAILDRAFQAIPDCGTVAIARNVSEAKAYLKGAGVYENRKKFPVPSAILSSYQIDGDSGVDLLAWAKGEKALREIPFVLLTPAGASPKEIAQAKRTGSVRVVKKPSSPVELKTVLERLAEVMCSDSPDTCHTDF